MKIKRRTVLSIVLALAVLWLFITWLRNLVVALPENHFQLSFACNGGADEERFLVEQTDTIVDKGMRCFTSPNGFVIYKFPIGDCELQRAFWAINQVEFRLEFSVDGKQWSRLVHIGELKQPKSEKFSSQSCGFWPEQKITTCESDFAYFRFRASNELQELYPIIKYFGLRVSGPASPEYFNKPSIGRDMLKNLAGLLPAKLMVIIGWVAVIICKKCWKTPWYLFGIGALLWMISVAAKFVFAFVAVKPVDSALHSILHSLAADVIFWIYIGLLTGVFECGIFLLLTKYIRRRKWTWRDAASLGVGFGAVEAVAVGVAVAVSASLQIDVKFGLDVAPSLTGLVERLIALAVHTASVVMIIYALKQRKWSWFVGSFFYKSGIDAVAAPVLLSVSDFLETHPWFVELCLFAPFALAGFYILVVLRQLWQPQLQIAELASKEPPAED